MCSREKSSEGIKTNEINYICSIGDNGLVCIGYHYVFIFNSVAVFATLVLAGILAVVCYKRYTSFRYFPLFTTLRMDKHYVQEEHIIVLPRWSIWLERLSLEKIYLAEAGITGYGM